MIPASMQKEVVMSNANQPEREIVIFFQSLPRRVRIAGMDDIETITDEPEKSEGEEPWCLTCREYTDYRRKWSTVSRANTDGGTYPDMVETPHCIDCQKPMLYLGTCRNLVWAMNSLAWLSWTVSLATILSLFDLSLGSLLAVCLLSISCFGISRIPRKSRLALGEWKKWKEEISFKELIGPKPKA